MPAYPGSPKYAESKTEKDSPKNMNQLYSPGESELCTMANTNANTSFILEGSEEQ